MTFWIIAGVILFIVLVILFYPLLQRPEKEVQRSLFDEKIYRDQLDEIDREVARGLISSAEAINAKAEVERRLLRNNATDDSRRFTPLPNGLNKAVLGFSATAIIAGSFGLYFFLGVPGMPDFALADRGQELERAQQNQQIEKMVNRLAQRLKEEPNDANGWAMLGRSYKVLGEMVKSRDAYEKAYRLEPANNTYALDFIESQMFETQGKASLESKELIARILEQDPENFKARFYHAIILAAAPETLNEAVSIWKNLLKESPKDAPWVPFLEKQIEENSLS